MVNIKKFTLVAISAIVCGGALNFAATAAQGSAEPFDASDLDCASGSRVTGFANYAPGLGSTTLDDLISEWSKTDSFRFDLTALTLETTRIDADGGQLIGTNAAGENVFLGHVETDGKVWTLPGWTTCG